MLRRRDTSNESVIADAGSCSCIPQAKRGPFLHLPAAHRASGPGCPRSGDRSSGHAHSDLKWHRGRRHPILVSLVRRLRPGRRGRERGPLRAPRMGARSHRRAVLIRSRGGPGDHDRRRVVAARRHPRSSRERRGYSREHARRNRGDGSATHPPVGGRNTSACRGCVDRLWCPPHRVSRGGSGNTGSPLGANPLLDATRGRRSALRAVHRFPERRAGRRGADRPRPVARGPGWEGQGHRR